jgi:hypothetical protein
LLASREATQRPNAKTIPGIIKANLVGRGDLLAKLGHRTVRAQAACFR